MRRDGFALLTVLFMVAILAVATLSILAQARGAVGRAAGLEGQARARVLADAGAARGLFELLAQDAGVGERLWSADGHPHVMSMEGGTVEVTVQDVAGLIDLNDAEPELLAGLFRSVGVDEGRAAALADAVADWRDEDDLRRANGAEADDYRRAGLAWRPRDGNFRDVAELRLVLGMTGAVFARVAPLLTVHGHRSDVDFERAPLPVLMAVPGMTANRAQAILAGRPQRPANSETQGFVIRAVGKAASGSEGKGASGSVFVRRAVVRLTREPAHPWTVLEWSQGERQGGDAP